MLYDLSPAMDENLKVWPGDEPPRREIKCHQKDGASVTLSTLHTTVHAGSHVDGPNHYGLDAPGIDGVPLERFIGRCQIVSASVKRATRVGVGDLSVKVTEPRVLIRTGTFEGPGVFNEDFAGLAPELIDEFASRGVVLVGVDTPSVDLFDSKDLPAHKAFLRNDVSILEGVILNGVADGVYELFALPLKLVGFDGSPVRAVVREIAPAQSQTE